MDALNPTADRTSHFQRIQLLKEKRGNGLVKGQVTLKDSTMQPMMVAGSKHMTTKAPANNTTTSKRSTFQKTMPNNVKGVIFEGDKGSQLANVLKVDVLDKRLQGSALIGLPKQGSRGEQRRWSQSNITGRSIGQESDQAHQLDVFLPEVIEQVQKVVPKEDTDKIQKAAQVELSQERQPAGQGGAFETKKSDIDVMEEYEDFKMPPSNFNTSQNFLSP